MKLPNTPDPQPNTNRGDYYYDNRLWNKRPAASNESTRLLVHALDGNLTFNNIDEGIVGEGLIIKSDGPFSKKKIVFKYSQGYPRFIDKDTDGLNIAVGSGDSLCITTEDLVDGETVTQALSITPTTTDTTIDANTGALILDSASNIQANKSIAVPGSLGLSISVGPDTWQEGSITAGTDRNFILAAGQPSGTSDTLGKILRIKGGAGGLNTGIGGPLHLSGGAGNGGAAGGVIKMGTTTDDDYWAEMNPSTGVATYQQTQKFTDARLQVPIGTDASKPATGLTGELFVVSNKNKGIIYT